jgi:hypothetical protein
VHDRNIFVFVYLFLHTIITLQVVINYLSSNAQRLLRNRFLRGINSTMELNPPKQSCGSVTIWHGSADLYHFHTNQEPTFIRIRILLFSSQRCQQKLFFSKFSCLLIVESTFASFFKDKKVIKKSQISKNQGFLTFFA